MTVSARSWSDEIAPLSFTSASVALMNLSSMRPGLAETRSCCLNRLERLARHRRVHLLQPRIVGLFRPGLRPEVADDQVSFVGSHCAIRAG